MRRTALLPHIAMIALLAMSWATPAHSQSAAATAIPLSGDVQGAHDPSIIRAGDTWYVFTTGKAADDGQLGIRCSPDGQVWHNCGHVFDTIPQWIQQRSPGTKDLWAPDISFEHGVFRLYYAYSLFGKNTSGIALATATTLDRSSAQYGWKDEGLVLESKAGDDFNAIDPNYFEDESHHAWLNFGSFWGGIKMRALDPATGKLSTDDTHLYTLAARGRLSPAEPHTPDLPPDTQAVEAPFLVHHGEYYYLFASFDLCCRGTKSTYRTMVGRSRAVTGPYLDRAGDSMATGGGTEVLRANARWVGPGGESLWMGKHGQSDWMVYHAYDAVSGKPSLQLSTVTWQDGWPQVALADR